jgi:hypothetical protein
MVMPVITDPAKPSQDFFGLIVGAIGCRPRNTPAAYPPTSEAITASMKHSTRAAPSSGTASMAAKAAKAGT